MEGFHLIINKKKINDENTKILMLMVIMLLPTTLLFAQDGSIEPLFGFDTVFTTFVALVASIPGSGRIPEDHVQGQ